MGHQNNPQNARILTRRNRVPGFEVTGSVPEEVEMLVKNFIYL